MDRIGSSETWEGSQEARIPVPGTGWPWKQFWELCGSGCIPGFDRRLWTFSGDRLGFCTRLFPLMYLFYPHLVMVLCFFGFGVIGLICRMAGAAQDLGDTVAPVYALIAAFGGLMSFVLVPSIMGRHAVVLDRKRGLVREVACLKIVPILPMLPILRRTHDLGSFARVELELDRRSWGKSSSEVYAVSLRAPDGSRVGVVDSKRLLTGRRRAEEVSRFTGLPMDDLTGSERTVRDADQLDEPLGERATRERWPVPSAPPAGCRAECVRDAGESVVKLPAPRFAHWGTLGYAALFLLAAGLAGWLVPPYPERPAVEVPSELPRAEWREPSPWPWRLAAGKWYVLVGAECVCAVTGGVLLLMFLYHLASWPRGYEIRAEPSGLDVRRFGPVFARHWSLPGREIEEIRLEARDDQFRLAALTDRRIVRFADGLSEEEAKYVRAVLIGGLAAARPPDADARRSTDP